MIIILNFDLKKFLTDLFHAVRQLDLARVCQREATPKRLRRARIHFSPTARQQLQAAFSKNQYPDYKERSRVAALIGVGEPRVQVCRNNNT